MLQYAPTALPSPHSWRPRSGHSRLPAGGKPGETNLVGRQRQSMDRLPINQLCPAAHNQTDFAPCRAKLKALVDQRLPWSFIWERLLCAKTSSLDKWYVTAFAVSLLANPGRRVYKRGVVIMQLFLTGVNKILFYRVSPWFPLTRRP